jgi:hypothetical protein
MDQLFKLWDDFKWKKMKYKVIYLVESYKFHIKFISIRIHKKTLRFFENWLTLTPWAKAVAGTL